MNDYTGLDQIFHRSALGSPLIAELSFDLERLIFSSPPKTQGAIYVTGLARAGTTSLMRGLYDCGEFASLTYDDMPFVLAPNLWNIFSKIQRKTQAMKERPHADGIMVNFNSPEALEEVFWRVHCGEDYIQLNSLKVHEVDPETIKILRHYQDLICLKYQKNRYLAKNNNHILRLRSLAHRMPDTTFLVLFREPVEQAMSLFNQHRRFTGSDTFTQQYMTWLVHHEFGATHRPLILPQSNQNCPDKNSEEFWISLWVDVYGYLENHLAETPQNVIPVSYERLCNQDGYWEKLLEVLELPIRQSPLRRNEKDVPKISSLLTDRATRIYKSLDQMSQDFLFGSKD